MVGAHVATIIFLGYYSYSHCNILRISSYRLMVKYLRRDRGAVIFNTLRFVLIASIYITVAFVYPSLDPGRFLAHDKGLDLRDVYFPYLGLFLTYIALKQLFFGASFAVGARRRGH